MPTKFSSGQANANNYVLGRGKLYFANLNAGGFPMEFRDLGNASAMSYSMETEEIEHLSSRGGLKTVDKKVVVSQTQSISFTLEEMNLDNLALFVAGDTVSRSQTSGSVTCNQGIWLSGFGRWYNIYVGTDLSAAYPPATFTDRVFDLASVTSVTIDAGGAVLVPGTDYLTDLKWGRIFILNTPATGTLTPTTKLDIVYVKEARTVEEVRALKVSSLVGSLEFIQENPADSAETPLLYHWHRTTLSGNGESGLISDEFGSMQFAAKAEAVESVDSLSPVLRITNTF